MLFSDRFRNRFRNRFWYRFWYRFRTARDSALGRKGSGAGIPRLSGPDVSAPRAVRAGLDLTRRSQEEAYPSRAPCTGGVEVRAVGHSGASWGILGWPLSTTRRTPSVHSTGRRGASPCAWQRSAHEPVSRRNVTPSGTRRCTPAGRQVTGSAALQHQKPVPVRGERPS
jgi:hypothetical protein